MTAGAAAHGTETITKSGRSAATSSSVVRKVGTPHCSSTCAPRSAVRVTTPVAANRSGIVWARRRKNPVRQPLPTIP
nr:hypothetical protein [Pseudonocardia sp. MH-G8]